MMTVHTNEAEKFSKTNGQYGGQVHGNFGWLNGPNKLSNSKTSLQSNGSSEKIHMNGFASTESIAEVEHKIITIKILPSDRRFGFSVIGGSDAGFPPRIEEISANSPAARSELLIDDEITEVNGMPVNEATHAEVIMQIHKCIQKKVITLNIIRYLDDDDAPMSYEDALNYKKDSDLTNEGFTGERSVDGEVSLNRSTGKQNGRFEPTSITIGSTVPSSFINPAFDKDDISDEDLDSSMAKPTPNRPRTLPIPTFVALVEHLKNKMLKPGEQEETKFLRNLFNSDDFQSAVRAHNNMTRIQARHRTAEDCKPVATNSNFLLSEVRQSLLGHSGDHEADELLNLVNKPNFQSLLLAHDRLAMRESLDAFSGGDGSDEDGSDFIEDYYPDLDEEAYKIVQIDKTNDPLGATVKNEGDAVVISRIVKGGAAEKSGLLHEGDEIMEINGNPVKGKTVNEVVEILREIEGTLTFVLLPGDATRRSPTKENNKFFRAQFDYDPMDDNYLPCRELGLPFRKGDILEIQNQEDPNWWQARKIDVESKGLAGLIPSKDFQQKREATKVTTREVREPETAKQKRRCFCLPGRKKKTKALETTQTQDFSLDEILTYEEMIEVEPDATRKRPIVLIGPPKVGRRELRQKLISSEPDRFAPAIPHTSRPPKNGEIDGKDYYFISQNTFQSDIDSHKFVEYGQFEGYYYGTSIDSIKAVTNNNKVCVLNLHCQALPVLKNSTLRPYVAFITLPSFDQIKRLQGTSGEPFNPNVRVKDEELMDLIERAREMDINYGHYFDHQITNQNLDKAYTELLQLVNFIETQPQWMPIAWNN